MLRSGVIEPVDTSEWATPLVPVLVSAEVLMHYDQNKPLILTTDASSRGISGVLTQPCAGAGAGARPGAGAERPVAYVSRSLNDAEPFTRSYVWWPGVDEAVEAMCRACTVCAAEADAPPRHGPAAWPFPARAWSRVHTDFLGPIDPSALLLPQGRPSEQGSTAREAAPTPGTPPDTPAREVITPGSARHSTPPSPTAGPSSDLQTSPLPPQEPPQPRHIFFVLLCYTFFVFIIYMNWSQQFNSELDEQLIIQKALNNRVLDQSFPNQYTPRIENTARKFDRNGLKYILLWTPKNSYPFSNYGTGRIVFIRNKCEFTNCYVTADRRYFNGDLTKFVAIAFNGRNLKYVKASELPQQRSPHQKYIFFNTESSANQPICNPWWDNFFNWTSTYKLNSDVIYSYIHIRDMNGVHVGPRIDMDWVKDMKKIDDTFKEKLKSKKKAAAWFVSHCITRSKREKYVKSLQKALQPYELTVDIYGRCGTLVCNELEQEKCCATVSSHYYFYLSFENAFAEDYVTEKLLAALNNDAVPIVLGGSNYTRFLPPGSYIDARLHEPESLAHVMADIIANPSKYHEFFRWRNHYKYSEPEQKEDVCNLCSALNDENIVMMESTYPHFRSWWNPDWEERCQDDNWDT
ncbi:alpha-(1,3)-fucosyltransferase C-like [Cydia splendana]|uniref:alpha-(1,3)-fucosyltransferase C-like n=1 Tax=Cydia splendana TaxID=1100963 RepID=UPI00300CFC1C